MANVPTEQEVLSWFSTLSNWGRWGDEDERGTLNYITEGKVAEGAREVSAGMSIGCARPIVREAPVPDVLIPPQRWVISTHEPSPEERTGSLAPVPNSASDVLVVAPHGQTVTHVDTLAHFSQAGQLYNGVDARVMSVLLGASRLSVATMKDGVVTRGVLLDIPRVMGRPYLKAGEGIFPEHLEAAEEAQGVKVGEGDALLVRTGWYRRRNELGPHPERTHRPGLHAATLPWLHERRVALIAADAAHDVVPSGYDGLAMPVHAIGTVAMGLCIVDACDFEQLAEACARLSRWSFLFLLAPLHWPGATGSPVTPIAVL